MTNYEQILSMSPEELALLFRDIIAARDAWWLERLRGHIDISLVECPDASLQSHLDWLLEDAVRKRFE